MQPVEKVEIKNYSLFSKLIDLDLNRAFSKLHRLKLQKRTKGTSGVEFKLSILHNIELLASNMATQCFVGGRKFFDRL